MSQNVSKSGSKEMGNEVRSDDELEDSDVESISDGENTFKLRSLHWMNG